MACFWYPDFASLQFCWGPSSRFSLALPNHFLTGTVVAMSGLTYSPPPPSFSFTLLWGFDDGIQLGKLVMLLGLENVDVNLKSLVLPLTIPSDEDGTGSLWKLLSWRTPWSSNMQDGGRYIIFVQETLFAPMGRHCANTFGDCAALRRPHWPAKQRCPSSPSHRCSCWSTH